MKKTWLFFASILLIGVITTLHHHYTKGFKLSKIINQNYQTPFTLTTSLNPEVEKILEQRFTYLGKGRQSYVFESEDKLFVIKFMSLHKYQKPLWATCLNFLRCTTPWHRQILAEKKQRVSRAMQSYRIANNELKEQTKLLYLSLPSSSMLKKSVYVKDFLGRTFEIQLDQVGFCIQKKAKPLSLFFKDLEKQEDKEPVKQMIKSLIDQLHARLSKGILNRDFSNILSNYGMVEDQIIEMDIGSFYKEKEMRSEEILKQIQAFTKPLKRLLQEKTPELVAYYEEQIADRDIKKL